MKKQRKSLFFPFPFPREFGSRGGRWYSMPNCELAVRGSDFASLIVSKAGRQPQRTRGMGWGKGGVLSWQNARPLSLPLDRLLLFFWKWSLFFVGAVGEQAGLGKEKGTWRYERKEMRRMGNETRKKAVISRLLASLVVS